MPRVMRDEDFDLPSGFADDFDAVVADAWFGPPREEYSRKAGGIAEPFLHMKLEGTDLDKPIDQAWSTGAARQWQIARDGKEVISGKNADTHTFMASSRAGELVSRVLMLVGEGDKAKGVQMLKERGYFMTEAEFYIGLRAHWNLVKLATVGGEERDVLMPTAFSGFMDSAGPAAVKPPALYTESELEVLVSLASGKTEQQVKQQVMRSTLKDNKILLNEIFNKNLLKTLENEGTLTRSPDGKFI